MTPRKRKVKQVKKAVMKTRRKKIVKELPELLYQPEVHEPRVCQHTEKGVKCGRMNAGAWRAEYCIFCFHLLDGSESKEEGYGRAPVVYEANRG